MAWTMTSRKADGEYRVYIGAVKIATLQFVRKEPGKGAGSDVFLMLGGKNTRHDTMSAAYRHLHAQLNAPPPHEKTDEGSE